MLTEPLPHHRSGWRALACVVWLVLGAGGALVAAIVGMWASPGLATLVWSGVAAGWLAALRRWGVVVGPLPVTRPWAQAQLVVASTVVLYFRGPPADLNVRFRLHWALASAFIGLVTAGLVQRTAAGPVDPFGRAVDAVPARSQDRPPETPPAQRLDRRLRWVAAAGWLLLGAAGGIVVTMLAALLSPGLALLGWTGPAVAYHHWLPDREGPRRADRFAAVLYAVQACGVLSAVLYFLLDNARRVVLLEPLWRGALATIVVASLWRAWASARVRAAPARAAGDAVWVA